MARDYAALVASLRRKAADPVVLEPERRALLERAEAIEKNHPEAVTASSRFTDDTTVTSRDGRYNPFTRPANWTWVYYDDGPFTKPNPKPGENPDFDRQTREAWDTLWNLHRNQAQWNKPPDTDDLYEEEYKYGEDEDEDYGYDIYEGEEYE